MPPIAEKALLHFRRIGGHCNMSASDYCVATWRFSRNKRELPPNSCQSAIASGDELMQIRLVPRYIGLVVMLSVAVCCGGSSQPVPPPPPPAWTLTWSDDFSGANGSLPDSSKWIMETGGNRWGNNELE